MGAAIAVLDGNISISRSQFVNNKGMSDFSGEFPFGVVLLFESEACIDNSMFMHNTAMSGGVLAAYHTLPIAHLIVI